MPGPHQGDKWSLFLPSHAFWLMLNPFGLIILIAVPAIKTTDAFVQLLGLQNVTKRFFGGNRVHFWRLIYDSFCTPTSLSFSISSHHHRLQQRAGAPHHASQASLKMYTRLWCQISQRKDSPFSMVSGEIFLLLFPWWILVMSAFD